MVDREPVLRAVLRELERRYVDLTRASGDADGQRAGGRLSRRLRHARPRGARRAARSRALEGRRSTSTIGRLVVEAAEGREIVGAATSSTSADRPDRGDVAIEPCLISHGWGE